MVRKPKKRTIFDIPVTVTCTVCRAKVEVPADRFSSDGGTYVCKVGHHEFPLGPSEAMEAARQHAELLNGIKRAN